jgi:hypothetical protein
VKRRVEPTGATLEITAGIRSYLMVLQAAMDAHADASGWKRSTVSTQPGRKYVRVVVQDGYGHQGPSAYSFVDRATGAIYYASSFRKPELKNPRGSVLDGSWMEWHGPHGAGYVMDHRPGQARRFVALEPEDYMVVRDAIMANNAAAAAELVTRRIREDGVLRVVPGREAKRSNQDTGGS